MDKKKISLAIKGAIILMAVIGLFYCAFILPAHSGLYYEGVSYWDGRWYLAFDLFVSWGVSIVCFAMLPFLWKVANRFGKDDLFRKENATILYRSGISLLVISPLYTVSNIITLVFSTLNNVSTSGASIGLSCFDTLDSLEILLGLIGMALGVAFLLGANSVKEAVSLKEDNEAII